MHAGNLERGQWEVLAIAPDLIDWFGCSAPACHFPGLPLLGHEVSSCQGLLHSYKFCLATGNIKPPIVEQLDLYRELTECNYYFPLAKHRRTFLACFAGVKLHTQVHDIGNRLQCSINELAEFFSAFPPIVLPVDPPPPKNHEGGR